ncbi:MAG: hypothetical protein AB1806_19720 [Acidobacteriota bacterium]
MSMNDERAEDHGRGSDHPRKISRRTVLAGALAAAGAGVAGAISVAGQVTGVRPGGGTIPYRLPKGALTYLDRNEYIHNMEIISFTPGVSVSVGEPLMNMWARGKQRLLPGGGGWLDISEPKKPVAISLGGGGGRGGGRGAEGGVRTPRPGGCIAYNTRLKKWLAMSSAGQPITSSRPDFPDGQYHEEERKRSDSYAGLRGIRTWDITDPTKPILLQEFSTGKTGWGTHMNFYDGGRYAYLAASWDDQFFFENTQRTQGSGMMVVDLTDPANVKEVSKFWIPGQRKGEEAEYYKYWFAGDGAAWNGTHCAPAVPKRIEDGGRYGYGAHGHYGLVIYDFADITKPKAAAQHLWDQETPGGIPYHTVLPLIGTPQFPKHGNYVIGVAETIQADCREPVRFPRILDVSDPTKPRIIGFFPRPMPPKNAPYADFCFARGRFGTHNCQSWIAPGTARPEIFSCAWDVAGARVHDLSDPTDVKELAWYVPARDGNIEEYSTWWRGTSEGTFVEWDRKLIWLSTHAGTFCLSTPALGKPVLEPMKIANWTAPHLNAGWDDATPAAFYFGRGLHELV